MIIRSVESLGKTGSFGPVHKSWKSLEKISPNMVTAVMASEDQTFSEHYGFDWEGIKRAMRHNKHRGGSKLRGGSTISQQTAKNVFLWPSRTWIRKGAEAYFTCLIELLWSKKRIMEVYLNVIEMGDGIYGAEAAAQKYYRKSAAKLSKQEAASIAAILPLPMKWSPRKPNAIVSRRTDWIIHHMSTVQNPEWNIRKKSS